MVHAENHEIIKWIAKRLLERGHTRAEVPHDEPPPDRGGRGDAPRDPALAAARRAGADRARSGIEAMQTIRAAQTLGRARSTPRPARSTSCSRRATSTSPASRARSGAAARRRATRRRRRRSGAGLKDGTFQVCSSDHAPYRFDETGKLPQGANRRRSRRWRTACRASRCGCRSCFRRACGKNRLTLNEFVALTATNHARMYGLHPRKGTIAVGSDADIAIWEPEREVTLTASMMHDNVGYTPYEGMRVQGLADDGREPRARRRRGRRAEGRARLGRVHPARGAEPVQTATGGHCGGTALKGLLGIGRSR